MPNPMQYTDYTQTNGYVNAIREPEIMPQSGLTGWIVENPGGDDWIHVTEQNFWSRRYGMPFRIGEYLGNRLWQTYWLLNWENDNQEISRDLNIPEPEIPFTYTSPTATSSAYQTFAEFVNNAIEAEEDEELELSAEYTNFVFGRPFLYQNRWYVVMEPSISLHYHPGQVWYCEHEGCEFELGNNVRIDLFGSENGYRIEWVEPEPEYDEPDYYAEEIYDEYSEERDVSDDRETAPVIATNIGRDVPYVSFEQEFSGNGELVARKLYQEGFGAGNYVNGYHSAEGRYERDNGSNRFCYVETDSSCGYELIFDRIQLNQRTQAEKIAAIQTILKDFKNAGDIRLSARCGFHVHVDVSNWGMKEIVSAYHLWNYLEDTIFRFASAFWSMHRDEEVGGGYSPPVPKGHTGRREIGRTLIARRDALNFSPILNARGNCSCQASLYEDWARCTCNVRQPTLEFRVFNATTNQRKIRAYLAFCVAFVNIAKRIEFEPSAFPEMRWGGTNNKQAQGERTWEELSAERIKFILEEFPLTNAEKVDIQYCLRNSSLEPVMEIL